MRTSRSTGEPAGNAAVTGTERLLARMLGASLDRPSWPLPYAGVRRCWPRVPSTSVAMSQSSSSWRAWENLLRAPGAHNKTGRTYPRLPIISYLQSSPPAAGRELVRQWRPAAGPRLAGGPWQRCF